MAETYEYLDVKDKNNIIINHIRNIEYNMFNVEISIMAAEAGSAPDKAEAIAGMQDEITEAKAKIAELKTLITPVA